MTKAHGCYPGLSVGRSLAVFTLIFGTVALRAGDPGVRPRLNATAYPVSASLAQGSVAAEALSRNQVHDNFAADLNKGYLVFEVSFYPNPTGQMKISPTDFLLKLTPQSDAVRTTEPAVAARELAGKSGPKQARVGGVTVVPVATVGYETGTYDTGGPNNNGQRHSGVYTSVGVAVEGSVGTAPIGPVTDRSSIEAELFDKSLPEGPITKATAGYLYFPIPKNKPKNGATYELQYSGDSGVAKLNVPVPHEK